MDIEIDADGNPVPFEFEKWMECIRETICAACSIPVEFILSGDELLLYRWLKARHPFQPHRMF